MVFAVEAWCFDSPEEQATPEQLASPVETAEFSSATEAKEWCWAKMHEGFQTRLWVR